VRAIDLDLAEVFEPSIRAIFGDRNPLEALDAYVDLDEYALLHGASRWARGEAVAADGERPEPGDGRVTPDVARLWRGILLRRPSWRAVAELRRDSRSGSSRGQVEAELRRDHDGTVRLDLAETDGRPENPLLAEGQLIVAHRDGSLDAAPLSALLERLPASVTVGRAYERVG
jgi:hypothetical protein